jgi:hypothetical protein
MLARSAALNPIGQLWIAPILLSLLYRAGSVVSHYTDTEDVVSVLRLVRLLVGIDIIRYHRKPSTKITP